MKINEFIKLIQEQHTMDAIKIKRYISTAEKIRLAKAVMDFSVEYDSGFIKFDSLKKQLAFTFSVIEAHTDLRFAENWAEKMQEYDALCEAELLDVIIDGFGKDYVASLDVLDMMCTDMLADNSIEASVAKLAQSISESIEMLAGSVADKIEDLDVEKIIPKDLDLNTLQRFLSKLK